MKERKNDTGELLGMNPVRLKRPEYGTGEYYNEIYPVVRWEEYRQDCADKDGFDLRNVEENGEYLIEINLPKDTLLIRYGSEMGRFTAPKNTEYDTLGLPYIKNSIEFHEYVVIADSIKVFCKVKRGKVAPMFDSAGGAVQYLHPYSMLESTRRKRVLKEVVK